MFKADEDSADGGKSRRAAYAAEQAAMTLPSKPETIVPKIIPATKIKKSSAELTQARVEMAVLRAGYWAGSVSHDAWFIVGCALATKIKNLEDAERQLDDAPRKPINDY